MLAALSVVSVTTVPLGDVIVTSRFAGFVWSRNVVTFTSRSQGSIPLTTIVDVVVPLSVSGVDVLFENVCGVPSHTTGTVVVVVLLVVVTVVLVLLVELVLVLDVVLLVVVDDEVVVLDVVVGTVVVVLDVVVVVDVVELVVVDEVVVVLEVVVVELVVVVVVLSQPRSLIRSRASDGS